MNMNDSQLLHYSRHILLDQIGIEAQQRFLNAHILIIGAGGLGSPAAMYLAASGIGQLSIVDHDIIELTNLQRQILHPYASLGEYKVISAQKTLTELNPAITIQAIQAKADATLLAQHLPAVDLVLDCSDNFETRYLINQLCYQFQAPLVSGAATRFNGHITSFNFKSHNSPCYHCLFPNHPNLTETNCATMGVFSPLVGIIGSMQAAEALKIIGQFGQPLFGKLLTLHALDMSTQSFQIPKNPHCPICNP